MALVLFGIALAVNSETFGVVLIVVGVVCWAVEGVITGVTAKQRRHS
jgi:drug/metabolite transporter (DMT)-like permease